MSMWSLSSVFFPPQRLLGLQTPRNHEDLLDLCWAHPFPPLHTVDVNSNKIHLNNPALLLAEATTFNISLSLFRPPYIFLNYFVWFIVMCYKPLHADEFIIYLLLFFTSANTCIWYQYCGFVISYKQLFQLNNKTVEPCIICFTIN